MALKELRERRGLTQAQLADRLNVAKTAVSNWETGRSKPLRKYRVALCQILGCTEQDLMGESPSHRTT